MVRITRWQGVLGGKVRGPSLVGAASRFLKNNLLFFPLFFVDEVTDPVWLLMSYDVEQVAAAPWD